MSRPGEPPSRKQSNASTMIDFADALDNGSYERRHVPISPEFYVTPDISEGSLHRLASTNSLGQSMSSLLGTTIDTRSSSNLSAFGSNGTDGSPSTHPLALHTQQSFSDARRAMQRGKLQREASFTSESNRHSGTSSSSAATVATIPPAPSISGNSDSPAVSITAPSTTTGSFTKPPLPPIPDDAKPAISYTPTTVSRQPSRAALTPSKSERDPDKPRIREKPHLHNFNAAPTSPALMNWSRAPVFGTMPPHGIRAHTTTLVDTTAWIFAGTDEKKAYNDVWCLDLESFEWSHPKMQGDIPPPCRAHSATAIMKQILVFGGGDGSNYYNHLYLLDTTRFRWTRFQPAGVLPPPRRSHSSVLYDSTIYVFGGGTGSQALGDLWALDVAPHPEDWQWVCLRANPVPLRLPGKAKGEPAKEDDVYKRALVRDHGGPGPAPRGYHTAHVMRGCMLVVGGSNGTQCYNDIWLFDLVTQMWLEIVVDSGIERPKLLAHTGMQIGSYLFVIGGHDTTRFTNDVRLLNLETMRYESKPIGGRVPNARGYHGTVLFDHRLFMIGGFDGQTAFSDVWTLDLAAQAYLIRVVDFNLNDTQNHDMESDEGDEEGTEGGGYQVE